MSRPELPAQSFPKVLLRERLPRHPPLANVTDDVGQLKKNTPSSDNQNMDISMQWPLALFLAVWLFYLGACIGSFMNVVIYRMPAGLRLWKPNSSCPHCLHAIRWHDNLPVISWMNLGGHCRDCDAAIPPRYPFVELFMGAIFLCIGVFEGISLGTNLPTVLSTLWSSWMVCGAHLILVSVLVCAAFMRFDGHQPPLRLYKFAIVCGLVAVILEPGMAAHRAIGFHDNAIVTMLAGLLVGGLIGAAITCAGNPARGGLPAILPWMVTGQFLGWQAVCWLVILTTLFVALRNWTSSSLSKTPTEGVLVAITIPWLVCWGAIVDAWPQWTSHVDASLMAVAIMFAVGIAMIESKRSARAASPAFGSIRNLQQLG